MMQTKVFFQENLKKDDFIESFLESSGGAVEVLCCIGFDGLGAESCCVCTQFVFLLALKLDRVYSFH